MAKLSAHGVEIGRIEFTTSVKAYMEDGKILKNGGFGWKLSAKCKDGVSPEQAFRNAQAKQIEFLSVRPCLKAYREALADLAGLSKRWKLHSAIQLLGDDYDGVWSEACDGYGDNVSASCDEVAHVCRLYAAAMLEQASLKSPETVTA